MTALVVGLVVGLGVGAAMAPVLASEVFGRTNFRGNPIATAAGIVIIVTVLVVEAAVTLAGALVDEVDLRLDPGTRLATVVVVLGVGLFGLLDDLAGDRSTRGFRGHLLALVRGRPTTGSWKLVGGGAAALVAVAVADAAARDDLPALLRGAVLVALAANLGNLFDLAPARTTKVATLAALGLAIAAGWSEVAAPWTDDVAAVVWGPLVVLGAGWSLLSAETGERVMLGDTGANVLGAAVGVLVVVTLGATGELIALAVVTLLNLASERVSFSRVIAATPPLRWLDGLGRG
ncbi:MAG: hypothetical protein AAGF02_15315 [Actinomycetota bacterium]